MAYKVDSICEKWSNTSIDRIKGCNWAPTWTVSIDAWLVFLLKGWASTACQSSFNGRSFTVLTVLSGLLLHLGLTGALCWAVQESSALGFRKKRSDSQFNKGRWLARWALKADRPDQREAREPAPSLPVSFKLHFFKINFYIALLLMFDLWDTKSKYIKMEHRNAVHWIRFKLIYHLNT